MQPEYRKPAPGHVVKAAFHALSLTQSAARKRLERASASAVCLWLKGERRIPLWAAMILANDMRAKAVELNAGARELENVATTGYRGSAASKHALAAYRVHRAAQKEKAGD